jgi:hypothetical protein
MRKAPSKSEPKIVTRRERIEQEKMHQALQDIKWNTKLYTKGQKYADIAIALLGLTVIYTLSWVLYFAVS